jgi:hypothetical protein
VIQKAPSRKSKEFFGTDTSEIKRPISEEKKTLLADYTPV